LRQRGSHRVFALGTRRAIVPMHGGDLKPGTLKTILDAAGLTSDQLRDLL
jgi:predicted RNA binding protein YcfA (HicA-like mRNA interferase family)